MREKCDWRTREGWVKGERAMGYIISRTLPRVCYSVVYRSPRQVHSGLFFEVFFPEVYISTPARDTTPSCVETPRKAGLFTPGSLQSCNRASETLGTCTRTSAVHGRGHSIGLECRRMVMYICVWEDVRCPQPYLQLLHASVVPMWDFKNSNFDPDKKASDEMVVGMDLAQREQG